MPQMSPYNWLILFMMFNLMIIFYNSYINFIYFPMFKKLIKSNKINFSWKW